jgi:LemA protein
MKTARVPVLLALLAVAPALSGCSYNSLVSSEEEVKADWSQVENVYQRRADLVPNLVATVKGSAAHEQNTLAAVTQARAEATQVKLSAGDLSDPAKMRAFEQAQSQLTQSLGRLLAVSENYPDLKANASFRDLQVQLEGTENRIAVERRRYNEAVQRYNTLVRSFPSLISAKLFGFHTKEPFHATTANAERAPEVKF